MGEGNGKLKSSKGKSSGNVLVLFYRQLPMGRKDTIFGVKYPNVLVSMTIRHYEDMFVEPTIYIRYVVLNIVILISMLSIKLFYLTQLFSFIGYFFEQSPLFIPYRFTAYP